MQAADPSELAPGTLIDGRYRVVRVIGVGGTGIVYEVEHDRTGQHLALKTLLDPAQAPRLEQEARALARLRSPHVVKVVELGHCDAGPFMVMTLLVGRNLRDVLESKVKLPLSFVANLGVQVCEGLDEAHRIGLVHRDLKPDNMHLADPAEADTETTGNFGPTSSKAPHDLTFVTVFDFGVVKMSEANSALTRTGSTVGTPYYMSLEQLRGAGTVDAQSDVYALCVVLYECLAGQRPFEAGTLGDLIFAICSITPVHLATARPDLPREITDTVMRGLSREKKERPPTMRDLAKVFAPHADPSFTTWLRVGDPPPPRASQGGVISGLPPAPDVQRVEVRSVAAGPSEPPTSIGPSPFAPPVAPSAPPPVPSAPPPVVAPPPKPSAPGLLSRPAPPKPVDEPSFVSAPGRPPVLAPTPPPPPPPSGSSLAARPPNVPAPADPAPAADANRDASRSPPRPLPPPPRIAALRSTAPLLSPPTDLKPPRRDGPGPSALLSKPPVAPSAPPSGSAPVGATVPIVSPLDEESSSGERDTPTEMFVPKIHGELEEGTNGSEVSASTSLSDNGAMPTMSLPAELALPKVLPEDKTAILDIAALQKNPPSPSPNYSATPAAPPSSGRGPSISSHDPLPATGMIPTTTLPQVGGPGSGPGFAHMTSRIEFGPAPSSGGPRPLVSSSTDVGAGFGQAAAQGTAGTVAGPKPKWQEIADLVGKNIDAVAKKAEAKFRAASQEVQIAVVVIGAAMLAMFLVLFVWALWL